MKHIITRDSGSSMILSSVVCHRVPSLACGPKAFPRWVVGSERCVLLECGGWALRSGEPRPRPHPRRCTVSACPSKAVIGTKFPRQHAGAALTPCHPAPYITSQRIIYISSSISDSLSPVSDPHSTLALFLSARYRFMLNRRPSSPHTRYTHPPATQRM